MAIDAGNSPAGEPAVLGAVTRELGMENEFELVTAGIDIGSATSHLLFSKILMRKVGTRYMVADRALLHQSPILLTPYLRGEIIDGRRLAAFVEEQYSAAGLSVSDISTGVVILTGVALARANSREIADRLSIDGGRFLAVSAGDNLEAVMSAYGSGAVALSDARPGRVLHIDIGGGTTKLVVCDRGKIASTAALDVGARLVITDSEGLVTRLEPAAQRIARAAGLRLTIGQSVERPAQERLARHMIGQIMAACGLSDLAHPLDEGLLRTPALTATDGVTDITVAGGVAEYFYGREAEAFGDLGAALAVALRETLEGLPVPVAAVTSGIRATVVGASQYTSQVSGSTIFISDPGLMPIRNIPVILPDLDLGDEVDSQDVAAEVSRAAGRFDLPRGPGEFAIGVRWDGSPSYSRVDALARGLVDGYGVPWGEGLRPIVVVCDEDVAALIGAHIVEEMGVKNPVIAIDGIELRPFDFIDIGMTVPGTGAVPVVIKSLLFPSSASGRP